MTLMSESLRQVRAYGKQEQLEEATKMNDKDIHLFAERVMNAVKAATDRRWVVKFAKENGVDESDARKLEKFKDDLFAKTQENVISFVKSYRW